MRVHLNELQYKCMKRDSTLRAEKRLKNSQDETGEIMKFKEQRQSMK